MGERKLAEKLEIDWHTLGDSFTWESTDMDETIAKGRHALGDSLGDNPADAPRYNELVALSQDCIRTMTGAVNFANSIGAQSGGTLIAETLACLRDAWAKLSPSESGALIEAGLNPGTTNPAVNATIDGILNGCKVDRSSSLGPPLSLFRRRVLLAPLTRHHRRHSSSRFTVAVRHVAERHSNGRLSHPA